MNNQNYLRWWLVSSIFVGFITHDMPMESPITFVIAFITLIITLFILYPIFLIIDKKMKELKNE